MKILLKGIYLDLRNSINYVLGKLEFLSKRAKIKKFRFA